MKKIIIGLSVIIVLAVAGLAVFIAAFDVNRYNKALSSQIENIIGNPVEIGRLSLLWKGRLLLGIEKFRILIEENGQKKPGLSFDRGDMAIELMPLLRMQVKISSISVIRPSVHLIRAKDGSITILGYSPKAAAVPAASSKSAGGTHKTLGRGRE